MLSFVAPLLLVLCAGLSSLPATAAPAGGGVPPSVAEGDALVLDAREAARLRDAERLKVHRAALLASHHPLAVWVDYWELFNRLSAATQTDLDAFYARWPGSYLEDRLRNDWLIELGHRRDWAKFAREYPNFLMRDDREVACYAVLTRQQAGEDVRAAAKAAWLAQRDVDEGCNLMAETLVQAQIFGEDEIWQRIRQAVEYNRPRAARHALGLLGGETANVAGAAATDIFERPQRFLSGNKTSGALAAQLSSLALVRLAANEPALVASLLDESWQARLPAGAAAWVWSMVARQGAMKLLPESEDWFRRADALSAKGRDFRWSDDALGWRVRAALRAVDPARWQRVLDAIALMSPAEQQESGWTYWKARALQAGVAAAGAQADAQRLAAQQQLERIAPQLNFYGKLASEDLGRPQAMPARPQPVSTAELLRAELNPGLARGLALIALGLRNEGVREWNFTLRGMNDRELLAAAKMACDREIWDRCIYASERTRSEIDMATRFPTPFRAEVLATTQEMGVEAAYVYGLIRQESRFMTEARSGVGAAGLMQLMPATARWTARKLGVTYRAEQIADRAVNLRLGTGYLKLVLDNFDGSQALAAAAYNAGPSRSRRWREGPPLEVAAWTENIPFSETREYVKRVLSNASYYAALLGGQTQVMLKQRMSQLVAPRASDAALPTPDLP
ncbi:MAG: transglycosylase SLT domain-containing protein [Leptothrix sp. (in: b-proteobacteria)]